MYYIIERQDMYNKKSHSNNIKLILFPKHNDLRFVSIVIPSTIQTSLCITTSPSHLSLKKLSASVESS